MIKQIIIDYIPHSEQRYNTLGDYYCEGNVLHIKVSDTGDEYYNELVAVHEMVEEMITRHHGIDEPIIMGFDEDYEVERELGLHDKDDEPGFDNRSPYRDEHTIAEGIEMMLCGVLGESWSDYNKQLSIISETQLPS